MNNTLKKIGIIGLGTFVVAISFFAGLYVDANRATAFSTNTSKNVDMTLFWDAWDVLQAKYIGTTTPITNQDKVYGAIKGLTDSLGDPYTTFMTPEETKDFQSDLSGTLEGIGAVLNTKDGILSITSIIRNSPAERAGVLAGERILKIDNRDTTGINIDEAVKLIRGKKGTQVTLTLQKLDSTKSHEVTITRDTITTPIVETKRYPNDTFVIKIISFTANSSALFRDALKEYSTSGDRNLIIDLRNNTGGYLDSAVDMASWFIPVGETVVTEDFGNKKDPIVYKSKGYSLKGIKDKKIVILVNENTASASEIFAGALRDYNKALLVGTKTFGKGSVQELVPLSEDTVLKVTIAKWLTPKGVSISHNGLDPDKVVDLTKEDYTAKKDPQLDQALSIVNKLK